jgi:hypothetical protein
VQSAHHWSRNFAQFEINDVASTWTVAAATVSLDTWNSYASVVFDKNMWVMGGETSAPVNNDIWYSSDGITWSQANAAANTRRYHASVMFNHKRWAIRGNPNENGTSTTNDVRYSSDKVAWIQATATTAWPGRLQQCVVLDNKIWVLGGVNMETLYIHVWFSSFGFTWNQAITTANCAAHGGNRNDVWYFGTTWLYTVPGCLLTYATALFSVILLQLAILVLCLFFGLIWNQKNSVSALFAQHEQTSLALVTATRGTRDQRSMRRRTNIYPRNYHCGYSLALISLVASVSSQLMAAPSFSSAFSPQHTSRALTGTSGMNKIVLYGNHSCLKTISYLKQYAVKYTC